MQFPTARLMNPLDMGSLPLFTRLKGTSWQRLKSARLLHTHEKLNEPPSWSGEPTRLRKRTLSHSIEAHLLETIGMCDLELTWRGSAVCDLAGRRLSSQCQYSPESGIVGQISMVW